MKAIVLKAIETLSQRKKDLKQFPEFVLDLELRKEIMSQTKIALRELRSDGKVKFGHTLNNKFIELIPEEKAEE